MVQILNSSVVYSPPEMDVKLRSPANIIIMWTTSSSGGGGGVQIKGVVPGYFVMAAGLLPVMLFHCGGGGVLGILVS